MKEPTFRDPNRRIIQEESDPMLLFAKIGFAAMLAIGAIRYAKTGDINKIFNLDNDKPAPTQYEGGYDSVLPSNEVQRFNDRLA